jgi:hypothetical protein
MTALTLLVATRLLFTIGDVIAWLVVAVSTDLHTRILASHAGLASGRFGFLVYVVALVVFFVWVHRATGNVSALGSPSVRFTPGAAVWSFLIPIVNLWQSHQVMAWLWSESQPGPLENEHTLERTTTLVNWWWGVYLFSTVGSLFLVFTVRPGDPSGGAMRLCVICLARLLSGTLFLWVVRATQRRQEEQWRDVELRAAVPAPTADVLR